MVLRKAEHYNICLSDLKKNRLTFFLSIALLLYFYFREMNPVEENPRKKTFLIHKSVFFSNQILIYSSTSFALSNENASDQLFDRFYKIYGVKLN